ncbi:MAG: hypothetical protein LBG19_00340, partial [Prevotellaceae bacterium]|nr:hypothetical protein [Prevotellaceae bacterium]
MSAGNKPTALIPADSVTRNGSYAISIWGALKSPLFFYIPKIKFLGTIRFFNSRELFLRLYTIISMFIFYCI